MPDDIGTSVDQSADRPGANTPPQETPDSIKDEVTTVIGGFEEVVPLIQDDAGHGLDSAERRELDLLREARNADTHTRKGPTPYPRPRPTQADAPAEYATKVEEIIAEYVSAQAAFTGLSTPASLRMQAAVLAFMYEMSGANVPEDEDQP